MNNLIKIFGGILSYVIVDEFDKQDILGAKAVIQHSQEVIRLPIRPSDGLALAIQADVPFFITERVWEKVTEAGKFAH